MRAALVEHGVVEALYDVASDAVWREEQVPSLDPTEGEEAGCYPTYVFNTSALQQLNSSYEVGYPQWLMGKAT